MKQIAIPVETLANIYKNLYNAEVMAGRRHCYHSSTKEWVGRILVKATDMSIEPCDDDKKAKKMGALFEYVQSGGPEPRTRQKTIWLKSYLQPEPYGETPLVGKVNIWRDTIVEIRKELWYARHRAGDNHCYHSWAIEALDELLGDEEAVIERLEEGMKQ